MSTITKTFTQEEKEAIRRVLIKIDKVKYRFNDYIDVTEVYYWWRPNKKCFNVRYEDFRKDTFGMWKICYCGTYFVDYDYRYTNIINLNTLLQLSDTVTMDVDMVDAYLYLLEQLKQEGVNNDYSGF